MTLRGLQALGYLTNLRDDMYARQFIHEERHPDHGPAGYWRFESQFIVFGCATCGQTYAAEIAWMQPSTSWVP